MNMGNVMRSILQWGGGGGIFFYWSQYWYGFIWMMIYKMFQNFSTVCNCLAPGGGCEVLFSPCLYVCVSVCLCVCPANMFVFYFSAIRRVYRILIGLYSIHTKILTLIGQRSRSQGRYIAFWRYSHITKNWAIEKFQYFFIGISLDTLFDETIKTWASREMTSQKIRQYLTLNM